MDSMGGSFGAGGLTGSSTGSSTTFLGIGSNLGTLVDIGTSNISNSYTLTTANSYKN
jgi:hypothetical protein